MRLSHLRILTLLIVFFSCNQNQQSQSDFPKEKVTPDILVKDTEAILKLIKQTLSWSETGAIDLLPVLTDSVDSIYIGFDMEKLKANLEKLRATGFFAREFIDNYNQMILKLDKNFRNKEYDKWMVGELPTFNFANDYDPWWNGQESFSVQSGIIEVIKFDGSKGDFYFKCGGKRGACDGLENYSMKFSVVKESNKWKISYMEGFDYQEGIKG